MKIHIIKNHRIKSYKINRSISKKQKNKDTGKKLFMGALSLFAAPIITACLANCLITKSVKRINAEEKLNAQVKTLENVYIGCSKEWIDEKLGAPTFMYSCEGKTELTNMTPKEIDYDFLACVYVTDIAVLKTYFGKEDNSCQAFFITVTDEKQSLDLPSTYRRFVNDKSIGKFSYYDIDGNPTAVGGAISNGNARTFYGETFNFYSAGNYYCFIFGNVDYGIDVPFLLYMKGTEIEWDDKTSDHPPKVLGVQNIKDRKENYPNTFGLASPIIPDKLAWELLLENRGFDSFQLKKDPFYYLENIEKNIVIADNKDTASEKEKSK
ncbi:MAG: hypothetical protein IJK30_06760 [Ruminococcus sp.]|nr:hypothetical protein [Ruminococcus sp.]